MQSAHGSAGPDQGNQVSGVQFPPTPVRQRSSISRVTVVAILVAFVAFVAGLEFGSPRLPAVARVTPVDVAPSIALSPHVISPTGTVGPPSRFAEAFAPKLLLDGLPGGSACVTQTAGFSGSGESPSAPLLVRVWLTSCPIPVAARRAGAEGDVHEVVGVDDLGGDVGVAF